MRDTFETIGGMRMRYREVKKGMKVRVYRSLTSSKAAVGLKGKVEYVVSPSSPFPVTVNIRGHNYLFSHKELKEVR